MINYNIKGKGGEEQDPGGQLIMDLPDPDPQKLAKNMQNRP